MRITTMNIQIFGKSKCFDSKKALRFFKERGIPVHYVDLAQRPMSKGELTKVIAALGGGADSVIDAGGKNYAMIRYYTEQGKLEKLLDEVHITANKNGIPFDKASPFITSGLRLGTPSVTTRGMKEPEMKIIGEVIADVIKRREDALDESREKVLALTEKFPLYANDIIE